MLFLLLLFSQGRAGKGSLMIFAAGNGAVSDDHCNADGYISNIHTIGVSSTTQVSNLLTLASHAADRALDCALQANNTGSIFPMLLVSGNRVFDFSSVLFTVLVAEILATLDLYIRDYRRRRIDIIDV